MPARPIPEGHNAVCPYLSVADAQVVIDFMRATFGAETLGAIPTPNVDAVYQRALDAGATSQRVPTDMFYGDRISMVEDKAGVVWAISTHKEDVSPEELARRMAAMAPKSSTP